MIREYHSKRQQIPNEIIINLIRNAHRAPSAGHTQVQEFIIVKDTSIKKRLRKAAVTSGQYAANMSSIGIPLGYFLKRIS